MADRGAGGAGRRGLLALLAGTALALGGCGVSYTSPSLRGTEAAAPVRVVELTPAALAEANRSPYSPRQLPAAFGAVAGGGSLRATGALPAPPDIPAPRAARLETRLPPDDPAAPYRIGVGDVVILATRGRTTAIEDLSGLLAAQDERQGHAVRDDGAVTIPGVGRVMLAGLTLDEAEARLFDALVARQIDPAFSLEIAEFNAHRVAVGGAVGAPGLVPVTLKPPTLGEAIAASGGLTEVDPAHGSIRLYRDGTLYQIPLETYLDRPELRNRYLRPGDAVFVDVAYDLDRALAFYRGRLDVIALRGTARDAALSALETEIGLRRTALDERRALFEARTALDAEARDYVYLAGEVAKQSRVALPYGRQATLADVLYDQGGFDTTTGDPSQIYVLRAEGGAGAIGPITAYHLNAKNVANMVIATRLQMRPNDIVFIEEQPITKWGRSLQQMFPALLSGAAAAAN